jgi:hypothetical protein
VLADDELAVLMLMAEGLTVEAIVWAVRHRLLEPSPAPFTVEGCRP